VSAVVFAVALVVGVWRPAVSVVLVVALAGAALGLSVRIREAVKAQDRNKVLEAENAGLKQALRRSAAGDANAVTQKLIVIGDDRDGGI
jgi:uncharacterized membrane protein YphA (DoxX/SURF4 family)